ncbi:riboflavin synthase [Calothrix sp. CCY 0018]|uniref:riboflavin synthase n=1 Tax=Calothrix sp. CCY 0018 TaxID=3103864 RepID=UPI0039C6447C
MFTGIIQALGTMKPIGDDFWQITCQDSSWSAIMQDLAYGDSVAVDGVCLTVEDITKDGFIATASPETLRRTILGELVDRHRYVNLETSLRVGGKVGGHFVMGHVDGIGKLICAEQTATSWEMTFSASDTIDRYIVPKGSIAINGISLTVAEYNPEISQFKVAVIPVTYAETNLRDLIPGSLVNLEGDVLGKYVEKFIYFGKENNSASSGSTQNEISPTFLAEHGYL